MSLAIIPEELIDAVTHGTDEVAVSMNDKIYDSRQDQFAKLDTELADRQEAL